MCRAAAHRISPKGPAATCLLRRVICLEMYGRREILCTKVRMSADIPLGKSFGRLTVVGSSGWHKFPSRGRARKVKCQCKCGKVVCCLLQSLVSGNTKSCGCLQKENAASRSKNKAYQVKPGTTFGRLTIIREVQKAPGNNARRVRARCVCGKVKDYQLRYLKSGATTSCGCQAAELTRSRQAMDVKPGDKLYKLTVLGEVEPAITKTSKGRVRRFLCLCDCGKETIVAWAAVRYGKTTSCGCNVTAALKARKTPFKKGQRFGRLTAVEELPPRPNRHGFSYLMGRYRCDCGNLLDTMCASVRSGNTSSCGCYATEKLVARSTKFVSRDAAQEAAVIRVAMFRLLSAVKRASRLGQRARKRGRVEPLLGCSLTDFKKHIESKFLSGMTWQNHGHSTWHVDHIKPLSAFNLTDVEERRAATHYLNLQPMWAADNMSKGAKWKERALVAKKTRHRSKERKRKSEPTRRR
jgi:hypothetical protein